MNNPTPQPNTEHCVFCARINNNQVHRITKDVASFEPLNPVTPGHMLFVPVQHVRDATEQPNITARVVATAAEYAKMLPACNIITSVGEAATQSIFHLHIHVVPRTFSDGLALPWTGQIRSQGTEQELREQITQVIYGANWRNDTDIRAAYKPDVEAVMILVAKLLDEVLEKGPKDWKFPSAEINEDFYGHKNFARVDIADECNIINEKWRKAIQAIKEGL